MNSWKVVDQNTGDTWHKDSRSEAEEAVNEFGEMRELEIIPPNTKTDGGETKKAEVVEDTEPVEKPDSDQLTDAQKQETTEALDELGESIGTDPLSVLPSYMITHVDGKPSLNKRGVSVLAYHYDIDVIERDVVAYPHENDFKTAVVEILVKGGDGRTFAGVGESHIDETPKHQLLRLAETRAYKRAVIFATGTGIVGYQEIMEELQ